MNSSHNSSLIRNSLELKDVYGDQVIWYVNPDKKWPPLTAPFVKRQADNWWWIYSEIISSLLLSELLILSAKAFKHRESKVLCKSLICEDCSQTIKQIDPMDTRLVIKKSAAPSLNVNKLLIRRINKTMLTFLMIFIFFHR